MKSAFHRASLLCVLTLFFSQLYGTALGQTLPLKRAVELALVHSTVVAGAQLDSQRAYAQYRETVDQYIPQVTVGSGLGQTWGYPLSLEGSAPSLVNSTAQSAVFNLALREFVRAARVEWQETAIQGKDQRDQVVQDTVLSYMELAKWESLQAHLSQDYDHALKVEQIVNQRIQEGVDNPLARNEARLTTARVYLHISQAQGSVDVLRNRLAHLTGLAPDAIQADADSMPALPEVKQDIDIATKAVESSPSVQMADMRATSLSFRARGEHKSLLPTLDFAAQYALLATFNNYQNYFRVNSFQQQNATVGVSIRFPFFNPSQHAKAQAADADALHAKKDVETTKNQVSEQTLKLQRSVEQLAAAQQVADLEYQIAKANLDAVQVRAEQGNATIHDAEDARTQSAERYDALQDANFELQRQRVALLRATGELNGWLGISK